jgi:hypothetical protein
MTTNEKKELIRNLIEEVWNAHQPGNFGILSPVNSSAKLLNTRGSF